MVGFDHDPFIITRASTTGIDLSFDVFFTCLEKNLIPHRGEHCLLSIAQACEFCMGVHDVANNCIGKLYIHDRGRLILMNYGKALIYEPLQEPNLQEPKYHNFSTFTVL